MIYSFYILSLKGFVVLEKHWKNIMNKSVFKQFLDAENEAKDKQNIAPIIEGMKNTLINLKHNDVYLLAICDKEIPPLLVIEFLKRVIHVSEEYFKTVNETTVEENLILLFEILDEMIDNGFPLITEPNILQELVRPPNIFRQIADQVTRQSTSVSDILPAGQLSIVPWRRVGVRYPNNEAYFDISEVVNAIIDKTGSVISTDVVGVVKANIHLSGMPDLTLHFKNPRLIDDLSMHPCVRYSKWEKNKILSFVPPDGTFELCSYYVNSNSNVSLPITIKSFSNVDDNRSYLDVTVVGNKINSKRPVESLMITITLPKGACNFIPKTCSLGKTKFNATENVLIWFIGKLEQSVVASLKGPIVVSNKSNLDQANSLDIYVDFKLDQCAISGVSVDKVEMHGEKYIPYKGVKYVTTAGTYYMRT